MDLALQDSSPPVWTFPRWSWERELLPAAQVVIAPSASSEAAGSHIRRCRSRNEAVAHIYGRGNAGRWGWLHADLGGDDLLELVSAVAAPGSSSASADCLRAPSRGRARLARAGLPAPRIKTHLGLPRWSVAGRVGSTGGGSVEANFDDRCVALTYLDPDGAEATCTSSELADAEIVFERRAGMDRRAHVAIGRHGPRRGGPAPLVGGVEPDDHAARIRRRADRSGP